MKAIVALTLVILGVAYSKVHFAAEVVRNGISTPQAQLPFFPEVIFPLLDELTPGGLRQLYLLGRLRRLQYIELSQLLPLEHDPSKIYARATDARKSLMSAQAYLLGLYHTGLASLNENQTHHTSDLLLPPIDLQVGDDLVRRLGNQAVPKNIPLSPIFSVNITADRMLKIGDCPYYTKTLAAYYATEGYKKLREEFRETWELIMAAYPLITEQYLATDKNAVVLAEYLFTADLMGTRPSKITKEIITGLNKFIGKVLQAQLSTDPLLQKIAISELSKEILLRMNQTVEGKTGTSFALYMGHEHCLTGLLLGLKSFNNSIEFEKAEFASNVLFELFTEGESAPVDVYVAVYYNGALVHKEKFTTFRDNFAKAGDIGKSWDVVCGKNSMEEPHNLREALKE